MAEPFYFMRYSEIIGRASNVRELSSEVERLSSLNPECVLYHVREGHISQWLKASGDVKLANRIKKDMSIEELLTVLRGGEEMPVRAHATRTRTAKPRTAVHNASRKK